MSRADPSVTAAIIAAPPKLHFWGGEWRTGGLGTRQLQFMLKCVDHLSSSGDVVGIETGAGLSTLVLLSRAISLTSFLVDPGLERRILDAIETYRLDSSLWQRILGYSEFTLPQFVQQVPPPRCNLALIDGGHGIHNVFTDYTYVFSILARRGILLIDDVQLPSCGLLHGLLKRDSKMKFFGSAGKLVAYEKLTDERVLIHWGSPERLDCLRKIVNLPEE